MCERCGICCTVHTILITFRDLREIHIANPNVDLNSIFVICEASETHPLWNEVLTKFPIIHFEENGMEITGFLALRMIPVPNVPQSKVQCYFFNYDTKLCKIHSSKPLVCRGYPLNWNAEDGFFRVRGHCPHNWQLLPDEEELMKPFVLYAWDELLKFRKEVDIWNQIYRGKRLEDFISFILQEKK